MKYIVTEDLVSFYEINDYNKFLNTVSLKELQEVYKNQRKSIMIEDLLTSFIDNGKIADDKTINVPIDDMKFTLQELKQSLIGKMGAEGFDAFDKDFVNNAENTIVKFFDEMTNGKGE